MKKTILSAKGVCKSFAHNGGQNHVLSHVDFDLYEGDFTVIMGASGSGKSTLLYALSGMDRATAGKVMYKEKDLVTAKEKELAVLRHTDFGFIFQQMHLVSNLTLLENITVPGFLDKSKPAAEVKERAQKLLEQMGISHVKTHLPSQVSGGEQQRCAIARAVIHEPKVLFADEPTGNLDSRTSQDVLGLLKVTSEQFKQTIVMITHDEEIAQMADRIIRIEDGKIVGDSND